MNCFVIDSIIDENRADFIYRFEWIAGTWLAFAVSASLELQLQFSLVQYQVPRIL